jgi:hypothetical protein
MRVIAADYFSTNAGRMDLFFGVSSDAAAASIIFFIFILEAVRSPRAIRDSIPG